MDYGNDCAFGKSKKVNENNNENVEKKCVGMGQNSNNWLRMPLGRWFIGAGMSFDSGYIFFSDCENSIKLAQVWLCFGVSIKTWNKIPAQLKKMVLLAYIFDKLNCLNLNDYLLLNYCRIVRTQFRSDIPSWLNIKIQSNHSSSNSISTALMALITCKSWNKKTKIQPWLPSTPSSHLTFRIFHS